LFFCSYKKIQQTNITIFTNDKDTGNYCLTDIFYKLFNDQMQKRYRDSGWLTSPSRGVMFRTGSNLSAFSALASCNAQTNTDYRIAAHLFGAKIIIDNRVNEYRPEWVNGYRPEYLT
jgi:hypothetical protein